MTNPAVNTAATRTVGLTPVVPLLTSPLFANRHHRTPEAAPEPVFGDDVWPLHYLSLSENQITLNINFAAIRPRHREAAKVYLYNVLNTETQRRTTSMKSRFPSAGTAIHMFHAMKLLLDWIDTHGLSSIADLTTDDWTQYGEHVGAREDCTYSYRVSQLVHLGRLWAHNVDLPSPYAFTAPSWFSAKYSRWLGPAPVEYENKTEPFHPEAISALIVAAHTVISGYLDGTLTVGRRGIKKTAETWFTAQGITLPPGRLSAENARQWKDATNWLQSYDAGSVRSAAFVLISYFTGMRPQEVLHLQRGCLRYNPVTSNASAAAEYTIVGREFKGLRDEYGDQLSQGAQRDQPWVTIEPAARAIEALEQLARPDTPYLFAWNRRPREGQQRQGEVATTSSIAISLGSFITLWNAHATQNGDPVVPISGPTSILSENQSGDAARLLIGTTRFRRTLAYHIANQPGGEIALGIQYGHVKSVVSLGYAGRGESGFPDVVELDALLGSWDDLTLLAEELEGGSAISGPAANRVRDGVTAFAAEFAGEVKTEAALERFKRSGLTLIHDNGHAHNVCSYVAATALCHPTRTTNRDSGTPDLTNCQRGCPNIALLDRHFQEKTRQRDQLLAEIDYLPAPLAARNQQIADELTKEITRHEQGENNS